MLLIANHVVSARVGRLDINEGTANNYRSAMRLFVSWAGDNAIKFDSFHLLIREWEQRTLAIGDNINNYRYVGRLSLLVFDMMSCDL